MWHERKVISLMLLFCKTVISRMLSAPKFFDELFKYKSSNLPMIGTRSSTNSVIKPSFAQLAKGRPTEDHIYTTLVVPLKVYV